MSKRLSTFTLAQLDDSQLAPLREEQRLCNYCDKPVTHHMAWTQTDEEQKMDHSSAFVCDEHAQQISIGMAAILRIPATRTLN